MNVLPIIIKFMRDKVHTESRDDTSGSLGFYLNEDELSEEWLSSLSLVLKCECLWATFASPLDPDSSWFLFSSSRCSLSIRSRSSSY